MIISDPATPVAPEQKPPSPALVATIRVAGVVISVLAAFCSGVLEVFGTQLRLGGVLIGVSVLAALLVNPAIAWFAVTTAGRLWAVGPPWMVWTGWMLFVTGYRTAEGDYLVAGDDWIALATVLLGSLAFAGYAYRMILRRRLES